MMSNTGCVKNESLQSKNKYQSNHIIKPTNSSELMNEHSQRPDPAKLEMLKAYNSLETNAFNSEMTPGSSK